eukprot:Skav234823  [mRNA]  locus=scaffold69:930843:938002:- [translate_table: standard]
MLGPPSRQVSPDQADPAPPAPAAPPEPAEPAAGGAEAPDLVADLVARGGNNFNKRLGHGDGPNVAAPKRVEALAGEHVIMSASSGVPTAVALPGPASFIDCEDGYSAAVLEDGKLFTWGCNGHGRSVSTPGLACEGVRSVPLRKWKSVATDRSHEVMARIA